MRGKPFVLFAAALCALAIVSVSGAQEVVEGTYRGVLPVVKFDVSPPLRDIPPAELPPDAGRLMVDPDGPPGELGPQDVDPLVQDWTPGFEMIPGPTVSFDGPTNVYGVAPPDPVGDVGPNHYVAMSNLTFAVYDKTGTVLLGPIANNTLWSGFGGDCQTDNDGDPIVLYDQLADRWILTQFTASGPTYFNCVAISTTPDPTGSYYRYAVSTGTAFPDYPKYGVWPDAYYISTRDFVGGSYTRVGAYALNRAQMIAGDPSPTIISFFVPRSPAYAVGDGLLPSDLDGSTLPPAGSPNYFVGSMDNGAGYGAPQDALTVWEFHADFADPPSSTFGLTATLPIAAYDTVYPCSPTSRNCIPQPGTTAKIDILSYRQRPLHRLAYRNYGTHESLVTNQSVEAAPSMAGIRWWELRDPGGTPTVYQEGTFAPGTTDSIHRWMGSIAMDEAGNMALGYSASAATGTYPSSWYTGRLSSDPLGVLPQGEGSIIDGTGSQLGGGGRWGDYTSMNVDPIDDCTFWYVNQYLPSSSSVGWRLRIGAFRFDECGSPDFYLGATPSTVQICPGDPAVYTINVGAVAGFSNAVSLSASGNPAGTTASFSVNPVTPPGSSDLTIGNTGGVSGGPHIITVEGAATGSPGHTTDVVLDVIPGTLDPPTLTSPPNGFVNQPLRPLFQWTSVAGVDAYSLEVDDNNDFSSPEISVSVTTNFYQTPSDLEYGTTYYWRVFSENFCGLGPPSTVFSFTTEDQLPPPELPFDDGFESGDTSAWTATVP